MSPAKTAVLRSGFNAGLWSVEVDGESVGSIDRTESGYEAERVTKKTDAPSWTAIEGVDYEVETETFTSLEAAVRWVAPNATQALAPAEDLQ